MLFGVVSLIGGSTTGVPMSPGYGGCQTATPAPYHTTTYSTTGSYTTKAQECYTTIHDAPSCYTESPKYKSAPSYITREAEYYTEAPKYYTTKVSESYTSMFAAPAHYTEAPHYYKTEALKYYSRARTAVPYLSYLSPTVTNCIPRVTDSQFCQLWRRAPVGFCSVEGWVDH